MKPLWSVLMTFLLVACGGGGGVTVATPSPISVTTALPPIPSSPFEATRTIAYTTASVNIDAAMQGKIKNVTNDPSGYGMVSFEGLSNLEVQKLKVGNILLTPDQSFVVLADPEFKGTTTNVQFRKAFAKEVFTNYKINLSGTLSPSLRGNLTAQSLQEKIITANIAQKPEIDSECKIKQLSPSDSAGWNNAIGAECGVGNESLDVELKFNYPVIEEKGEV